MEETLAQFMKVSMSNQNSTKSAIKNLEVQVGQLAMQLANRSSSSFTANIEKNPKEDCKATMTRSRMAIHVDESEAEKKMEEHKQQLAPKQALELVSDFVELEDINEEVEDDNEEETPIKEKEKERIKEEEKEKEKKLKNEKQKEKVVDDEMRRGKSEANIEKKKDTTLYEGKEVPYPLVPSRKEKERHLARFLDIFKKLEITLPFGEAIQQIPFYAKLLKGMLTKKNRQITLIAQHDSSRLGFPALITALCKARGVHSDSLTHEKLSPIINLAYIKKNCWNLDDPTVTFRGPSKAKGKRSEAPPSSEVPPSSAPTPIPSVPSASTFVLAAPSSA
ncbi:hypothetical protein GmHk_07G019730 [Glycine max]|nr:hypothetical protein GmHk_07G019730 [Glycine max]